MSNKINTINMELKDMAEMVYNQVEFIYKKAFEKGQQNEQWFLNWLDDIDQKIATQW